MHKSLDKEPSSSSDLIEVRLLASHRRGEKWCVEVLATGKVVHFGQAGASDFTVHKDAARMLRYLVRHGANMPEDLRRKAKRRTIVNQAGVIRRALAVTTTASREDWGDGDIWHAVARAGFWSRWLTWSFPDMGDAMEHMRRKFNISFV